MRQRRAGRVAVVLVSSTVALLLVCFFLSDSRPVYSLAPGASRQAVPQVLGMEPTSAFNDLDTRVVITGSGFVSTPTVYLGDVVLAEVHWLSSESLEAIVPWGLDPGVYTVTIENPDGEESSLPEVLTVTQGIGVWSSGELFGGVVESIVVNPDNPTTLYASSSRVGLFRSRDGGTSWTLQFSGGAGVMHPVVDPGSPDRVYVHGPWNLFRSDDEGDNWIELHVEAEFPYTPTLDARCPAVFVRPYVDPVSETVYAVACNIGNSSGVIRSDDYGDTWEAISEGITDTHTTALAFHPEDPQTIYVGTGSGHVFVSSDRGASWTHAAQPVGCVGALAVNPSNPDELWVASNGSYGDPCVLRRSTGPHLEAWDTLLETDGGCSYPQPSIVFDPEADGVALVAGLDFVGYRTNDGGTEWTAVSPAPDSIVNDLVLAPGLTETIYLAENFEGVYKTSDDGATWGLVHHGLSALFPVQMETVPGQPDVVYAVFENDSLYEGTRGGHVWQRLPISRVVSVLVDPNAPTRVYAGKGGSPAYVSRSDDGGETWDLSTFFPRPAEYGSAWSFPHTLLAVPGQPGTLLAGVQHQFGTSPYPASIYRSTDYGDAWEPVYAYTHTRALDLANDAVTPTIIYAAIPNGHVGLLRSADGGESWERTGQDQPGMEYAQSIAVEPVAPYRVFVMTDWPEPYLYVSEDHGISWEPVTAPPDAPNVEQILSTADQPPVLYAAGAEGLFRSGDGARSWQAAGGDLGRVPVYSMSTVTATQRVILYVGTSGGVVTDDQSQVSASNASRLATDERMISAGVYRYTSQLTDDHLIYLPLVLRP